MRHLFLFLKGMLMGAADLVPGVSGGTIALITGIYKELLESINSFSWNTLKNIKNDTLIIWGDKDKSYDFSQIEILNKNITNSKLKIIRGCSHNVHLEKPDEFNNCIIEFLQ